MPWLVAPLKHLHFEQNKSCPNAGITSEFIPLETLPTDYVIKFDCFDGLKLANLVFRTKYLLANPKLRFCQCIN